MGKTLCSMCLLAALAAGGCGGDEKLAKDLTALLVTVRFDPGVYAIDRFRFEGYLQDGNEAFAPGELPEQIGGVFTSGEEDVYIFLADDLAGQSLVVKVWASYQGQITAFGRTEAVPELGRTVEALVVLEDPPVCGDGQVHPNEEECDTAIPPDQAGGCPVECNDGNPCTQDTLLDAGTCRDRCDYPQITEPFGGDGCCPPGADAATDSDCLAVCGNGVLEPGELCDPGILPPDTGACPESCDDTDPCTDDVTLDPGTCQARCLHQQITQYISGDECCPAGGNNNVDSDCPPVCGNGAVEQGESCDTGIPSGQFGACPTQADCDDSVACTDDTVDGDGTCQASCAHQTIAQCIHGDGCCPPGCDLNQDDDCTSVCGDGVVDAPNETCDVAISEPDPGACPTSCDDGDPCTEDVLVGDGTCQAYCDFPSVGCVDNDGCCPAGCDNNTDDDCPAVCGNGVVEPAGGETCDTGISSGDPGACPTQADCDDGEPCTADTVVNDGTCEAYCDNTAITTCASGDGCCPAGCTVANDTDCAGCGNAVTESQLGEECDDGDQDNFNGCTTSCTTQTGAIGDPCRSGADCDGAQGVTCADETTYQLPGGYCFKLGCNQTNPIQSCPSGSICVDDLGSAACVELCQDLTDCRWVEGYDCQSVGSGFWACLLN